MDLDLRGEFERYLRFEVSLAEVRTRLGGNWHFERDGHSFELTGDVVIDTPVEVNFDHVANAVDLVLGGRIPAGALEEWANLLLLSDVYAIEPRGDEMRRDRLLQCLHELASPSMYGDLDAQHLRDVKQRCKG